MVQTSASWSISSLVDGLTWACAAGCPDLFKVQGAGLGNSGPASEEACLFLALGFAAGGPDFPQKTPPGGGGGGLPGGFCFSSGEGVRWEQTTPAKAAPVGLDRRSVLERSQCCTHVRGSRDNHWAVAAHTTRSGREERGSRGAVTGSGACQPLQRRQAAASQDSRMVSNHEQTEFLPEAVMIRPQPDPC